MVYNGNNTVYNGTSILNWSVYNDSNSDRVIGCVKRVQRSVK